MTKKLVIPLVLGLIASFVAGGWLSYRYIPKNSDYTPAVQWVIEHPSYAEGVYQAYKQHVRAAEMLLEGELGALAGTPTPTPLGKD